MRSKSVEAWMDSRKIVEWMDKKSRATLLALADPDSATDERELERQRIREQQVRVRRRVKEESERNFVAIHPCPHCECINVHWILESNTDQYVIRRCRECRLTWRQRR